MISLLRSARAPQRPRVRFVPTVDGLEGRLVLSATTPHVAKAHPKHVAAVHHGTKPHHAAASQPVAATTQAGTATQQAPAPIQVTATPTPTPATVAPSLNQQVVAYLVQKLGQRVGSGECADLAVQALRVAGAKFANIAPDSPSPGDYVWGTLVKVEAAQGGQVVDSAPGAAIQPGDILQFHGTTFANGVTATHHTAVVAAVDAAGRVTQVFQQNITSNGGPANRTDTLSPLDLAGLTGGTVAVYRPIARVATPGSTTFSVVNNATTPETVALSGLVVTLTGANTTGSSMTFTANGPTQVVVNAQAIAASDGAGYQILGSGPATTLAPMV